MTIRNFQGISPNIAADAWVDESAVVIGDVVLGSQASVWPCTVVRGDVNRITIGAYTNVQDGSVLHVTHESSTQKGAELTIGEYVTVGHAVVLHACIIGDYCLIGMGSTLLDNAVIGNEVMIGANSLVPANKVLESGYLYVGSPVKQVRPLKESEKAFLRYSATHYAELKDKHAS